MHQRENSIQKHDMKLEGSETFRNNLLSLETQGRSEVCQKVSNMICSRGYLVQHESFAVLALIKHYIYMSFDSFPRRMVDCDLVLYFCPNLDEQVFGFLVLYHGRNPPKRKVNEVNIKCDLRGL